MSRAPALGTTSYALLGLLAVRSWTTYELTRQMDRSLGRIWPRAVSKLYEEPKKLVRHGLATATPERTGARRRTVYAITPAGRAALTRWLSGDAAPPALESEHLLRVFFSEHGSREDLLANLAAMRGWAVERNAGNREAAAAYAAGTGPFQERFAQTHLVGRFLTDFYRMTAEWADWAAGVVQEWPADLRSAQPDRAAVEETLRRAAWS